MKKPIKTNDTKPLDLFTVEQLALTAQTLSHFNVKNIHSSAKPTLILRLSPEQKLSLPYVCVRTLGPESVYTDYCPNMATSAGPTNFLIAAEDYVNHHLQGKYIFDENPEVAKEAVCIYRESRKTGLVKNDNIVPPYLRQLFLPKEDSYLIVSPISAGGVSKKINQKMVELGEQAKKDSTIKKPAKGELGIGGNKKQNVGAMAFSLSSPLFFSGIQASTNAQLYAKFYKGVQIYLRPLQFQSFVKTWNELKRKGIPPLKSNAHEKLKRYLESVVEDFNADVNKTRGELKSKQHLSTDESLIHAGVNEVLAGAIDVKRRNRDWSEQMALLILRQLKANTTAINGENSILLTDVDDDAHIVKILKRGLA